MDRRNKIKKNICSFGILLYRKRNECRCFSRLFDHTTKKYKCLLVRNEDLKKDTILNFYKKIIDGKKISFYPNYLSDLRLRSD